MQRYLLFTSAVLFLVFSTSAGCTTGSVRLDDGILEICNNSAWKTVCSEDWGNLDAAVACKQLEFDGGYTVNTYYYISNRSQLNPVSYHCNGTENNLQNCDRESYSWCSYGVNITCVQRNSSDSCRMGDIRLWGGSNQYEGNIELCTDRGIWSTVSDYSWDNADAVVACRQLAIGYANSIAVPTYTSKFGRRLQAMEYGGMNCRGNESSLMQCGVNNGFVYRSLYNQRDYAGVRCIPRKTRSGCNDGDVRLANGYSNNNGFAEVCIEGQWIRICKIFYFDPPMVSSRLCRQLGYQRFTHIDETFFTLNRSEPLAYVYEDYGCPYRSTSQTTSVLDCISNSTSYGYRYSDGCTDFGILCCPNDTTRCSFTEAQTCPPENPTTQPTSTPSTVIPTEGNFALHFGSAASSLILANSADLRGLKKDIKKKIQGCLDEERDCSKSTLNEGFLSIGENIRYEFESNMDAAHCVDTLKDCLEKNPRMQYHSSDLYLNIEFEYTE